jgi:hypothetical protein
LHDKPMPTLAVSALSTRRRRRLIQAQQFLNINAPTHEKWGRRFAFLSLCFLEPKERLQIHPCHRPMQSPSTTNFLRQTPNAGPSGGNKTMSVVDVDLQSAFAKSNQVKRCDEIGGIRGLLHLLHIERRLSRFWVFYVVENDSHLLVSFWHHFYAFFFIILLCM